MYEDRRDGERRGLKGIVPFKWLAIVRDNGKTVAQYELTMPEYENEDFNNASNAFNDFKIDEIARSQSSRIWRRVTFTAWNDAEAAKIVRATCMVIPTVWDLFASIEYDHLKKKYT